MDRTLAATVALLALSLVVAGGVVPGGSGTVQAQADNETAADRSDRTITVSGQGTAEAAPDQTIVGLAVVSEGDDPAAVRSDLAEGADELRQALTDAGVSDDQVETTAFSIHSQHPGQGPEREPDRPAYRGMHAVQVTLDDVNASGAVIDAAANASAEVQFVSFTLSDERRDDLRDEALEGAMSDARRQAETLAAAGDLNVTTVRSVDASEQRGIPHQSVALEDAASGRTTLQPGDVAVRVTVQVTYEASTSS